MLLHTCVTGTCIIGGYMYRGSKYPNMVGSYLFADFDQNWLATMMKDTGGAYYANYLLT